jgi:hypothetical protein
VLLPHPTRSLAVPRAPSAPSVPLTLAKPGLQGTSSHLRHPPTLMFLLRQRPAALLSTPHGVLARSTCDARLLPLSQTTVSVRSTADVLHRLHQRLHCPQQHLHRLLLRLPLHHQRHLFPAGLYRSTPSPISTLWSPGVSVVYACPPYIRLPCYLRFLGLTVLLSLILIGVLPWKRNILRF